MTTATERQAIITGNMLITLICKLEMCSGAGKTDMHTELVRVKTMLLADGESTTIVDAAITHLEDWGKD